MKKISYFQGTEEPKPKQKQYKSEPKVLDRPRYKHPLYHNYDLYGDDGPGSGFYQNMQSYKSVADFLKSKRKKSKDKYKGDHQVQYDDGSISTKQARRKQLLQIIKNAIDFPLDSQTTPILSNEDSYVASIPVGGFSDYTPLNDLEDKPVSTLNFSQDYQFPYSVEDIINQYLNPAEPALYGDIQTEPVSDLDANETSSFRDSAYGIEDSGSRIYDKI